MTPSTANGEVSEHAPSRQFSCARGIFQACTGSLSIMLIHFVGSGVPLSTAHTSSEAEHSPGHARGVHLSSRHLAQMDAAADQHSPPPASTYDVVPLSSPSKPPQPSQANTSALQPQHTGEHVHSASCGHQDPYVKQQQEGYALDYVRRRNTSKAALYQQQVRMLCQARGCAHLHIGTCPNHTTMHGMGKALSSGAPWWRCVYACHQHVQVTGTAAATQLCPHQHASPGER
jgi:hypothetical protein